MKKKLLIIGTLALLLVGCRDRAIRGYGYNTGYSPVVTYPTYSSNYNTVGNTVGSISVSPLYTRPYYYNYGYSYDPYGYGYGYQPYTYNYGWNLGWNFGWRNRRHHCLDGEPQLNFQFKTSTASEERNVSGENLRAQTFGKRTEVQYGNENEKLNFLAHENGKTFVSGKVLVDEKVIAIDSKSQKCNSTRTPFEDDPQYEIAKFDCTDGNVKIAAEVLIASHP